MEKDLDPYCKDIFQTVVENVDDIVVVLNEKLEIIYINQSVERILGRNPQEMKETAYKDIFSPGSWEKVQTLMNERFEKVKNGNRDDRRVKHQLDLVSKDGREVRTEFFASPIYENDKYKGAVVLVRDVSQTIRVQEELLKRDEMLHLINKIMRHDIRNRLSIAFGFLGLIRETRKLDMIQLMKAYDAVGKAIRITKRMSELETLMVNGLETEAVDIKQIIDEVSSDAEIKIEMEGNCLVRADKALASVFENLINNSIVHGNASQAKISVKKKDDFCHLLYADNGEGMPERMMSQIFEEGVSFGSRRGSGLGLFIVKRTIERYGGTITVGRNQPNGLFFRMMLPLWSHEGSS
jgi:PAS domain S-box-containing protein